MSDSIERQAAIDAAKRVLGDHEISRTIHALLRILPSAQSEPCEDVVSRQRLLNDLKELIATWEKYPVMAEQIKGVETAIGYVEMIPSVTPKRNVNKWIPISEKLPEETGEYLVTDHTGCLAIYTYYGSDSSKEYYGSDSSKEYWKRCVLAWMPLPEPWNGGKGNQ